MRVGSLHVGQTSITFDADTAAERSTRPPGAICALPMQLAGNRPEDARPARVAGCVDDHCGVLVERDQRSVVASEGLLRAHDDGLHHFALLDRALRGCGLDGRRDDVPDTRVTAL